MSLLFVQIETHKDITSIIVALGYTTGRKILNIFGNLISLTNILISRLQIKTEFWFEPFGVNLLSIRW